MNSLLLFLILLAQLAQLFLLRRLLNPKKVWFDYSVGPTTNK